MSEIVKETETCGSTESTNISLNNLKPIVY